VITAVRNYFVNLLAQGFARVLATGSTIIVFVLAARLMSIDELGRYSMIMAFANVFAVLSQFGTNEAMGKAVVSFGSEGMARFVGNFLTMRVLMGLGVILIAVTAAFNIRADLTAPLVICALGIPFVSARFFEPVYQVLEHPHYSAIASTLYSALFIAGSTAALYLTTSRLPALMATYITANILYFACSLFLLFRLVKFRMYFDWPLIRRIAWLAAPLAPAALYSILNNRVDIFILTYLSDDYVVGLYSAAYRLVDLLAVGAIILVTPLIPIFSRIAFQTKQDIADPLSRSYEIAAFFAIPFVVVMPAISTALTVFMFGERYSEAAALLNILSWVALLILFSLLSSAANLALGAIKHGYWSGAVAVTMNILLNFIWIPNYGAVGAAFATLASSTIWLLISQYYTQRELGNFIHGRYWLTIVALNGLLWILLYPAGLAGQPSLVVAALGAYLIASFLLRLRPITATIDFICKHS
jgi:O-antigen/teichoic acid export membrane protein